MIDQQKTHQGIFAFLFQCKLLTLALILIVFLGGFLVWKKIPIRCIVLTIRYCSSAEDYSHSVPGGQEFYVAFRLPVNVPIFSPFDGVIFASFTPSYGAGGFPMEASLIQIRGQDGNNAMNIVGSIEAKVQEGDAVQKGQVIAVTTETLSDSPNGYAIAVRFLKKDTFGGMQESGELFERFFPAIFYPTQ